MHVVILKIISMSYNLGRHHNMHLHVYMLINFAKWQNTTQNIKLHSKYITQYVGTRCNLGCQMLSNTDNAIIEASVRRQTNSHMSYCSP